MVLTQQFERSNNPYNNLIELSSIIVDPINFEIISDIFQEMVHISASLLHCIFNVLSIEIFFAERAAHITVMFI